MLATEKEKNLYLTYRPFYASNGLIVKPGTTVQCTEIEAMCINTMQAMTLRKTNQAISRERLSK